jgi:hypothetical protein
MAYFGSRPKIPADLATIIHEIGKGVYMSYGVTGSGSNEWNATNYLKNNLAYNNVELLPSAGFEQQHATDMLNQGLPFYIDATSDGGRHAWVIDGYLAQLRDVYYYNDYDVLVNKSLQSRFLLHCNFGWTNEIADGYYISGLFNVGSPVDHEEGVDHNTAGAPYYFNRRFDIIKYSR